MPSNLDPTIQEFRDGKPTGKVSVDMDELLSILQRSYALLAPVSHQWPHRNTAKGQALLSDLRENIAALTGRDGKDIQDEYCEKEPSP